MLATRGTHSQTPRGAAKPQGIRAISTCAAAGTGVSDRSSAAEPNRQGVSPGKHAVNLGKAGGGTGQREGQRQLQHWDLMRCTGARVASRPSRTRHKASEETQTDAVKGKELRHWKGTPRIINSMEATERHW